MTDLVAALEPVAPNLDGCRTPEPSRAEKCD